MTLPKHSQSYAESQTGNNFRSSLRVVIAEQEQAIRDALIERVESTLGLSVDAVNTAAGVRKLVEQRNSEYVLAVVDTRLPDAPNGEVLSTLIDHSIPTIAISSVIDEALAEKMTDKHIVDCVLKRENEDANVLADIVQKSLINPLRKILYFSNNDFSRKKIRQLLDIHRYNVVDVRTTADIRRKLSEQNDISLVLIDESIPEADAIDMIGDLRQHYRREDLSIVAIYTDNSEQTGAKLLRVGASEVIRDQISTDEFYYRIKNCVESVERVRELKYSATRDMLTGAYNRDYLFDVGEKLYSSAKRGSTTLSLAVIEIDHLDKITTNDGPQVSNTILSTLAGKLQNELRSNDIFARYDASTFLVLATDVSDHNAIMVFERLKQLIGKTTIEISSNNYHASCSIGATTDLGDSLLDMIGFAQDALATAIDQGRNNVVLSDILADGL